MKKLLLLIIMLFTFSIVSVNAEELQPEDVPIVEEDTQEIGFFENIVVGIYNFIVSPEFTKLATSISALMLAIYPFIKKYLSAKAQAKYERVANDLADAKLQIDQYRKLALDYAKVADDAANNVKAIKDSLLLGFDKSNLRQDIKDKIMTTLNSVPQIETIKVEEPVETAREDKPIIIQDEKDNHSTEPIPQEPSLSKVGW